MTAILDFRENRADRVFDLALSCGCNVSLPMQRSPHDLLRAVVDLQKEHADCGGRQ